MISNILTPSHNKDFQMKTMGLKERQNNQIQIFHPKTGDAKEPGKSICKPRFQDFSTLRDKKHSTQCVNDNNLKLNIRCANMMEKLLLC